MKPSTLYSPKYEEWRRKHISEVWSDRLYDKLKMFHLKQLLDAREDLLPAVAYEQLNPPVVLSETPLHRSYYPAARSTLLVIDIYIMKLS
jgi:hypothetical protein